MSAELQIKIWALKNVDGELQYTATYCHSEFPTDSSGLLDAGWVLVDEGEWHGLSAEREAEVKVQLGI